MRNLTSDMATEFSSRNTAPALLAELFFDTGTLRLWTGIGDLTVGDDTYTGAGNLIGISSIQETQELQAKGIVCTLNGISASIISLSLNERSRGRAFKMYLAVVDTSQYVSNEAGDGLIELEDGSGYVKLENSLVDSPYRIFSGLMDVMEFTTDGKTATVRLSVENVLIKGQRAKISRYTQEDQRKLYPTDKGLEFINQLQDKEIVW